MADVKVDRVAGPIGAVALQADCSQCAGLCCVALAFDKSDMFAFDKPAGQPCKNLTPDSKCAVHERLEPDGFAGCVRYDCGGAGQRVTQAVFKGASWQKDPALLAPMIEAFRAMRSVHENIILLRAASALPLDEIQRSGLAAFEQDLHPQAGWDVASLSVFEQSDIARQIKGFLRGLRDVAGSRRAPD
jgi:hypothetical protein